MKNNWEEVIFPCFWNCFAVAENVALFISFNKIHATKYMQAYIYITEYFIFILFPFSFICVQIKHKLLPQKLSNYPLLIISMITRHGTKKVLLIQLSCKGLKPLKTTINKYWFLSFSCKRIPSVLNIVSEKLTAASWALDTIVSYIGGKLKDLSTCSFKFSSARKRNKIVGVPRVSKKP